jgi:CRISPR-associated protein Cas4
MKISVSLLSSYLFCPRKLFLDQVLKLRALPAEATVKGTIKHNVLDLINKQEKGIVGSVTLENASTISEKYIRFYSKNLINSIRMQKEILDKHNLPQMQIYNEMWPFFELDANTRASYVMNSISEFKVYGLELWEKLTPKILTEVWADSEILELKGKIDRIEKYSSKIIPVEVKTGRAPSEGVWEGHLVQIGAYMMLLEEKYKIPVQEGKVHYLGHQTRNVKMNPYLKQEIFRLKDEVKKILTENNLPPFVDNENKCKKCPLREQCYGM